MFTKYRLLILCLLAIPALAFCAGMLRLSNARLPVVPGPNASGYFTLLSQSNDRLTGVTSDCCTAVEIHEHAMEGNVMRMRRVESLPVMANVPLVFAPNGLHLMLIGLKKPLAVGDRVEVMLHFAERPDAAMGFTAVAPGLQATGDSPKDHHDHNSRLN